MKPVKPRWKDGSALLPLLQIIQDTPARLLAVGSKVDALTQKISKGMGAGSLKQAKQIKFAATIERKKRRLTDQ